LRETPGRPWWEVGMARQLSRRAAKRARIELLVIAPLLAAVLVLYAYRRQRKAATALPEEIRRT
jgi:small conductance mechanosensitive channel